MLTDKRILITGATGNIARPIAERLVTENEVWCAARFTDPALRAEVEDLGMVVCPWDLASGDNAALPDDFTHVIHAAALIITGDDHESAVQVNAEGTGLLMQHCGNAEGFLFVSTAAVYRRQDPQHPHAETDPLGGLATYDPAYPIGKIATEGAVRAAARMLNLPTTIARMNIGCGPHGAGGLPSFLFDCLLKGEPVPVPAGYDNWGSPISQDDIAWQASGPLFDIASVPATIVNWAGDEAVSHREICQYMGGLVGVTPTYIESPITMDAFVADNTRRLKLIGPCKSNWRDALKATFEQCYSGASTSP
jgi:nucleoside-diphosphate-sugar epimerase